MAPETRYSEARAKRAIEFFERILVHTKGRYARKPFLLDGWQKDILSNIFGWEMYDDQLDEWVRLYQLAWIELARKNGKSELLSGIALLMLCADDEESAEVYSVACDRDQASLVFNVAKRMVELSPALSKRLEIVDSRKRIIDHRTNSVYAVLPGDAGGALGTNPSAVLFDEVLTQRDRHLWDAMRQGFGTRTQPLMVAATTASYTSAKFCLEEHEWGERVTKDPTLDPRRYVFQRNVPRDWDWTNEGQPAYTDVDGVRHEATGWYWANPALGSFLNVNSLRNEAVEAKNKPQAQNAFRVFRLNQWVAQATRWIDVGLWDASAGMVNREALLGREAFGGLDLGATSDFCAWCLAFPKPDGYDILWRFWVPEDAVKKRGPMAETMDVWRREGFLTVHEGPEVILDAVEADIRRDLDDFTVRLVGFDPWQAPQIIQRIEQGGIAAVKVPQTCQRLNAPSKEVERTLALGTLTHGANPIARWMIDNVDAEADHNGNIKPSRRKSAEKIDGISALCNALFAALLPPGEMPTPVGFFSLSDYLTEAQ